MTNRETRIRIDTLSVPAGFDVDRFKRLLTKDIDRQSRPDRGSVRSAMIRAAVTAKGDQG